MKSWFDKKTLFNYLIIVILILILILQRCGNSGDNIKITNDTIKSIETKYYPVEKLIPKYIPVWNTKIERDTTFFHTPIDTNAIILDYYATYYYKDTIKGDTLNLYINDSISENKIKSRNIKYTFNYPVTTIQNTVIKNKNEFYIGLGLTGSKNGISYFGPELLLRTKKKQIYNIGVGINGDLQPQLRLSTYWKIGKK